MEQEEVIYSGSYVQLTELKIADKLYEKAYIRNAVIILAIKEDGSLIMVEEKRDHEDKQSIIRTKPVTGFIDDGDTWQETAHKELQEEVKLDARQLLLLQKVTNQGNINVEHYYVVATGLFKSAIENPDGEETITHIKSIRLQTIIDQIMDGSLPSNSDNLAFLLLKEAILNKSITLQQNVL